MMAAASIPRRWMRPRREATSAFWECVSGSGRVAASFQLTSTPGAGTSIHVELDVPPVTTR